MHDVTSAAGAPDTAGVDLDQPLVSVVIPTHRRPDLVLSAVKSALSQTLEQIEVIVVVDGEHEATTNRLGAVADPRLQIVVHKASQGAAEARNMGVRHARAPWVAFLDDDDEWLPDKLRVQLPAAQAEGASPPIVACRFVARTDRGDFIWPSRLPTAGEHLSDYLLDRPSPFSRAGFIATPTILASRELLLAVPFPRYERHEDWAWLLIAIVRRKRELIYLEEPLCIVNWKPGRPKLADTADWRSSLSWLNDHRDLVTPTAYAAFLLTSVARTARRQRHWRAFWHILRNAHRHGRPRARHWLIYLITWLLPAGGHTWARRISFHDAVAAVSDEGAKGFEGEPRSRTASGH